jgi:hypothetical protein
MFYINRTTNLNYYRALTELRFFMAVSARGHQNCRIIPGKCVSLINGVESFLTLMYQRKATQVSTEIGDVVMFINFRRGSVDWI